MQNFKAIITTNKEAQVGHNQEKIFIDLPLELEITIDKNNQIHDIQPRTFKGVDIFSKYHGRTSNYAVQAAKEIVEILLSL